MFSGSFLDDLELPFFIKLWWQKFFIFLNAKHGFAKGEVISKCKNDKPWKNEIAKLSVLHI